MVDMMIGHRTENKIFIYRSESSASGSSSEVVSAVDSRPDPQSSTASSLHLHYSKKPCHDEDSGTESSERLPLEQLSLSPVPVLSIRPQLMARGRFLLCIDQVGI